MAAFNPAINPATLPGSVLFIAGFYGDLFFTVTWVSRGGIQAIKKPSIFT
jgi:hypothetical protein